ncbi:hypothetical protein BDZ89DRAFT_1068250 [Hymenopellis radicata]|nr:hypothetical protein BDZ89DRAFT_1068225 [Hymenopellis radicata]KAF9025601.1 hypothetical protein BDZ89DRAFT_1068250 [Hymenopellis radicata]
MFNCKVDRQRSGLLVVTLEMTTETGTWVVYSPPTRLACSQTVVLYTETKRAFSFLSRRGGFTRLVLDYGTFHSQTNATTESTSFF